MAGRKRLVATNRVRRGLRLMLAAMERAVAERRKDPCEAKWFRGAKMCPCQRCLDLYWMGEALDYVKRSGRHGEER